MWPEILRARFGINGEEEVWNITKGRDWWNGALRSIRDERGDWFQELCEKKIVSGNNTRFWEDRWVTENTLMSSYPRLYRISLDKSAKISEMGRWENGSWKWALKWRRKPREWEVEVINILMSLICRFKISRGDDYWRWRGTNEGIYTVKSAYRFIQDRSVSEVRGTQENFHKIWNSKVDPKVKMHGWRVLQKRIPILFELHKRGCIASGNEDNCPLCTGQEETIEHRFFTCPTSKAIWKECLSWIRARRSDHNSFSGFQNIREDFPKSVILKDFATEVWLCVVWMIWKERNRVIFKEKVWDEKKIKEEIKTKTWWWWKWKRGSITDGMRFTDWVDNPIRCLT